MNRSHRISDAAGAAVGCRSFASLDADINLAFASYRQPPVVLEKGDHLAVAGKELRDLYMIESGSLKDSTYDRLGREHVWGFYLPGEITGIDTLHTQLDGGTLSALESTIVYTIPYPALTELFVKIPGLSEALLRTMSRYSYRAELLAGDYRAEELLAGFIIMLSKRLGDGRAPADRVTLSMSRRDLANHLRLAPETVSRLLTKFAEYGLIRVSRRTIYLLEPQRLSLVADSLREM
ncbi:MAG TPA: helix-turn-helix domain-containing protein [Gammaproteobacteria bacterium]|nr:helix-turn-helix domain-containing protein [Gammaproteobacteria bacterium]